MSLESISRASTMGTSATNVSGCSNSLGTGIVQRDLILSVDVGTPMADLHGAFQFAHFQNRLFMIVVNSNGLLVLFKESSLCGWWDILVGAIHHGSAGFGHSSITHKCVHILGLRVSFETWNKRPIEGD